MGIIVDGHPVHYAQQKDKAVKLAQ